jgi:hypothetical protein
MKRNCMILALGFAPMLIVLGVIRITNIPIADAFIALTGSVSLSWALLNLFDVISTIYTMLDDATQAVKEAEDDIMEKASNHLTIAVLSKINEMRESIEKEEG